LRYFTIVRDLQKQRDEPPVVSCPGECGREQIPPEEIAVLSSCGHAGCYNDIKFAAESETCVYARSGKCKAAARVLNIVKGDTLGVDDYERNGKGKHFGMKLEKVIHLIRYVLRGFLFAYSCPDTSTAGNASRLMNASSSLFSSPTS
jgi:hypothetical protein